MEKVTPQGFIQDVGGEFEFSLKSGDSAGVTPEVVLP
jgi:hypothetical protein